MNRKTKDTIKIDEATPDNRYCFDLVPLPDFDYNLFPYCVAKARKAVSLINVKSGEVHKLMETSDSGGNWRKLFIGK